MRFPSRFLICLAVLACATGLQASEIEVTIGHSLVAPGGAVDYLPVYIHTDTGTVNLAATSFEFQITTNGSVAVQFVNSSDPSMDPTFGSSNYVFSGVSGDQAFNVPLGTATSATTFSGADEANNSPDFFVPLTTTPELLGLLPITTLTNTAPPLGDAFTVSLVPYSASNPITFFVDDNGSSLPINSASFAPSQVNVVPEPSTLALAMIGVTTLTLGSRWRRKA
ncbi:MAG TPA: PEP-CTERM sorting domain-containing protein [Pirellulales bacterium]|nr:PEP-CTERM sorting domain-containing protein [Pirellulales bacterium]